MSFCLIVNFGREELMQRRILTAQQMDEPSKKRIMTLISLNKSIEPMNLGWKFVVAGPDLVAWGEPFTGKLKIWCFNYKENGL